MTTLDFIRHGTPEGGRRYRGASVDDPLSEKGWRQMWLAVGDQCSWDLVVSSPLQRCLAFAGALAERHGLTMEVEPDFREVGFGAWEGYSPDEVARRDPKGYASFYADPVNNRPPGAEDLLDFGRRVAHAFDLWTQRAAGNRLLVVAHAGVIRAALGHVLHAPPHAWYRVKVDNAGITRFVHENDTSQLVFHNRVHHHISIK